MHKNDTSSLRKIFHNSKTAKVDTKSQISDKFMVVSRYQNTFLLILILFIMNINIMSGGYKKQRFSFFVSICQIIKSAGP